MARFEKTESIWCALNEAHDELQRDMNGIWKTSTRNIRQNYDDGFVDGQRAAELIRTLRRDLDNSYGVIQREIEDVLGYAFITSTDSEGEDVMIDAVGDVETLFQFLRYKVDKIQYFNVASVFNLVMNGYDL